LEKSKANRDFFFICFVKKVRELIIFTLKRFSIIERVVGEPNWDSSTNEVTYIKFMVCMFLDKKALLYPLLYHFGITLKWQQ